MKTYRVRDGERIRPAMTGDLFKCCDCALVHRMDFEIVDGRVEIIAWRDDKTTKTERSKPKTRRSK